jgi:tetratricopeptide (TPR) repeat protein
MTKQVKILILTMVIVVGVGILIAWIYYRNENSAEDPRVSGARQLLSRYDELMREGNYEAGFPLLDSAERIYQELPCYAESYEMGVVYNNRGSAWLSLALYKTDDTVRKAELLFLAEKGIRQAIAAYESWSNRFDSMSAPLLESMVKNCFPVNDKAFQGLNYRKLVEKRTSDLELAKVENRRRLSVAYSNLGIIQRHQYELDSAITSYITALKLWKRNPTAKNNLNRLLGKPAEDESFIDQLFPPDRRKPD